MKKGRELGQIQRNALAIAMVLVAAISEAAELVDSIVVPQKELEVDYQAMVEEVVEKQEMVAEVAFEEHSTMEFLFGKRKSPEEMLRQNQRALTRAIRETDRERQKLEKQEKKIIADTKKMAKQGQLDAVKIMAKDLVRTRQYMKKFILRRANIQAVPLKIQTLKSNNSMAQAMKGVTKANATMNRQLKLPQIQKMMEFEKQSEIMDMKEEMMNDTNDDAMGDEDAKKKG